MTKVSMYAHEIQNPEAYDRAVSARIKANASKTRRAKWMTEEGNSRLYDWLNQVGEFASKTICGHRAREEHMYPDAYNTGRMEYVFCEFCQDVPHPLTKGIFSGDFGKVLLEMRNALDEWGSLSEKQTELVRNALARAEKWEAERQAKYAAKKAEDAKGVYVGQVGVRQDFDLVVERTHSYETDFGYTYINVCRDKDNNVVVYKGSNGWNKGEKLVVKATVKEHSEYEGVKQTMIQRPKVLSSE